MASMYVNPTCIWCMHHAPEKGIYCDQCRKMLLAQIFPNTNNAPMPKMTYTIPLGATVAGINTDTNAKVTVTYTSST